MFPTLTQQHLDNLYAYDLWAQQRAFDAAEALEGEAYTAFLEARAHGVGSARDLLVHIADAQNYWLDMLEQKPASMPDKARLRDIPAMREHAAATNRRVRDYLASLGEEGLAREFRFSFRPDVPERALPVGQLLHHVAIHGVQHRAEASELLTAAGSAPRSLDWLAWVFAQQAAATGHAS